MFSHYQSAIGVWHWSFQFVIDDWRFCVLWDHPSFLVTLRQPIQFKALLSTIFLSRPIQNNSIGYKFFVSSHRPQACEDERYGIREVQKERERERTNILPRDSARKRRHVNWSHSRGHWDPATKIFTVTWSIGSGQGDGQETCKMHPRLPQLASTC
jgi:hypothetical protein